MRRRISLLPLLAVLFLTSSAPSASACEIGPSGVSRCCKVCSRGKACGNSCIARNRTCHKGRGCACNA